MKKKDPADKPINEGLISHLKKKTPNQIKTEKQDYKDSQFLNGRGEVDDSKDDLRKLIQSATEAFLFSGGVIKRCPPRQAAGDKAFPPEKLKPHAKPKSVKKRKPPMMKRRKQNEEC